jgi:hypothetical protein
MADNIETVSACLDRIEAKYERRGKSELWNNTTREEFLRAFVLVPFDMLPSVVDEMLLNPPSDDRGRELNWLPDPSDIVRIARKMTADSSMTSSDVVSEIMEAIRGVGYYGEPSLSAAAGQVVRAMGGWQTLCAMEAPDSVINGLLLKHAANAVERDQQRLIIATREPKQIAPGIQKQIEARAAIPIPPNPLPPFPTEGDSHVSEP